MSTATLPWNDQAAYATALDARQLHLSVFPLDEEKKPPKTGGFHADGTPKRLSWKRYQTQLPTVEQINAWERHFHPGAWGIITGATSRIITLDFDGEQGKATLDRLGLDPHRRTGSGGFHVDFQHPGWRVKTLNHETSKERPWAQSYPGLDIRADGGYAAFVGYNTNGKYTWLRPFNPAPLDLLPEALRRALGLLYSDWVQWGLDRIVRYGGRDFACFHLSCQLRDNAFPSDKAESIIRQFVQYCPPTNAKGQIEPFTEAEALATLKSAYGGATREAWRSTSTYQASQDAPPSSTNGKPTGTDLQLCVFDPDDAGNGDAMYILFGHEFLWISTRGWFTYTGTHWQLDQDGATVAKKAVETLRLRRHAAVDADKEMIIKYTRADQQRVNGCISRFKTLVSASIDEFDTNPDLLNCQNGVVDLRTGELTKHSRDQRFTYCVPVAYEPASCAEWIDYLHGVVGGGQEVIDYLQMALGYSLTGHTREEILFYLFGPLRSGKGTLAEVFLALLPYPLSKMVDFNSFTAKREGDVSNFDLAPLKPSRLIFASESNRTQSLNPAKIKQLTGGDHISACFKHKDFFDFRPQFKVWMMSNHPVNGDPEDDALWARVRVIEFPNSFLGREDKSKKARLKQPEALQGVLYWAVQGAIKWYSLGAAGLTIPEPIATTTNAQRADLDYVQQWLDEKCDPNDGEWVSNEEIMTSYLNWCKSNNVQYPKGPKALSQSLKAKGYEISVVRKVDLQTKKGVVGMHVWSE